MARNRKRRNARLPSDAPPSPPGVATARPQRDRGLSAASDDAPEPIGHPGPESLEHAAPDAEIAEAQLAAGEAAAQTPADGPDGELEPVDDEPADDELAEDDLGEADDEDDFDEDESGAELTHRRASTPRRRNGLIAFAQGSWRELQRVQWPDQRQVVQATGVVLGFVIVAGAYLGLADWVATKIVHIILS